jgi:hypothetical protein
MKILFTNKLVLDLPKKMFVKKLVGCSELHHKDYPDCNFSPSVSFDVFYYLGEAKIPKKIESKIVQTIEDSVSIAHVDLRIVNDDYHLIS